MTLPTGCTYAFRMTLRIKKDFWREKYLLVRPDNDEVECLLWSRNSIFICYLFENWRTRPLALGSQPSTPGISFSSCFNGKTGHNVFYLFIISDSVNLLGARSYKERPQITVLLTIHISSDSTRSMSVLRNGNCNNRNICRIFTSLCLSVRSVDASDSEFMDSREAGNHKNRTISLVHVSLNRYLFLVLPWC
jgi:hypothetical protein